MAQLSCAASRPRAARPRLFHVPYAAAWNTSTPPRAHQARTPAPERSSIENAAPTRNASKAHGSSAPEHRLPRRVEHTTRRRRTRMVSRNAATNTTQDSNRTKPTCLPPALHRRGKNLLTSRQANPIGSQSCLCARSQEYNSAAALMSAPPATLTFSMSNRAVVCCSTVQRQLR